MSRVPPVIIDHAKLIDGWQRQCSTPKERNRYLLEHELWTDCEFVVGKEPNQKLFKCHRINLGKSSHVFEDLLYGDNAVTEFPVNLPDIQPSIFKAMLDYVYCDEMNISTREEASALMCVAKKYNMQHLIRQCQKYLCSTSNSRATARAM